MIHEATLLLGSGPYKWSFNTFNPATGAPITLAGSPSLYARINGGASVTDASLTIDADFDDGGGAHTGEHQCVFDVDDATLALAHGDSVEIFLGAGTVDGNSVANVKIAHFQITDGTLPAATQTGVQTAAAAALTAYDPPTNAEMVARTLESANYATAAAVADVPTNAELAAALDAVPAAVLAAADSAPIAANVKEVNDVTVSGDGKEGTEWGPSA